MTHLSNRPATVQVTAFIVAGVAFGWSVGRSRKEAGAILATALACSGLVLLGLDVLILQA